MSLDYDYTAIRQPITDEERRVLDILVFASMAVGVPELTEKTAPEFYARLALYEKAAGPFMHKATDKGHEPYPFTVQMVRRFIGLKTNASNLTRAAFFKRFMRDLDDGVREYAETK